MTFKKLENAKRRSQYSSQFKEQALERTKIDVVSKVAKDLGIAEGMIYSWRKKLEQTGIPFEDQKIQSAELARLKRERSRLSEENPFLKKGLYFG